MRYREWKYFDYDFDNDFRISNMIALKIVPRFNCQFTNIGLDDS